MYEHPTKSIAISLIQIVTVESKCYNAGVYMYTYIFYLSHAYQYIREDFLNSLVHKLLIELVQS